MLPCTALFLYRGDRGALRNCWFRPQLEGRSIFIVEDEPLIALCVAQAFERADASVVTAHTIRQASVFVENDGLSAAVLDHTLGDGNSDHLCERLKARAIPFVTHSGLSDISMEPLGKPLASPSRPTLPVAHLLNK